MIPIDVPVYSKKVTNISDCWSSGDYLLLILFSRVHSDTV